MYQLLMALRQLLMPSKSLVFIKRLLVRMDARLICLLAG